MLIRRLAVAFLIVVIVAAIARLLGLYRFAGTPVFFMFASALLAVGLYSSTACIEVHELHGNRRLVFTAITVGVVAKALIISALLFAVFRDPAYLVIGMALAQIDPLSVAALRGSSRLSPRGRAILSAWASFDDPVTSVLTILLAALAVAAGAGAGGTGIGPLMVNATGTLLNVVFVLIAALVWFALLGRLPGRPGPRQPRGVVRLAVACVALVAMLSLAVAAFLMLGLAVAGVFFRPVPERIVDYAARLAFLVALVLLGVVVAGGVHPIQGLVLGVTAYASQIVVGAIITRRLPIGDRVRLSLSQQSGITAIILALLLEPVIPGTVATVAPAILVVNVLHLVANTVAERKLVPRPIRAPAELR